MTAKTAKAPKPRKQPRPTREEWPAIKDKDLVSLAAHDFLRELSEYDWEHIDTCLHEGIEKEIAWWIEHNVENVESGLVEADEFPHGEVEASSIAERIKAHIAGWNATDVIWYGSFLSDGCKWKRPKD